MANSIQRDKHRRNIVSKLELQRIQYKYIIRDFSIPKEIKNFYIDKLNRLPRDSSSIRTRNRCILTGRGRAVFRFCKLSRIALRELVGKGQLPGIKKSSW